MQRKLVVGLAVVATGCGLIICAPFATASFASRRCR